MVCKKLINLNLITFYIADPVISVTPNNMSIISQKIVTLACSATGKPTPAITWSFNGGSIDTQSTKYNQSSSGSLTILIESVADEGTYQCTATNRHSSDSAFTLITVQGQK